MSNFTQHPFGPYVRALGAGPRLSRPLTQAEACDAMRMILSGQAEPVQVGAFLCLLRVRTETPEEVAGLAQGCRDSIVIDAPSLQAQVDWPSWAGKTRHLPLYVLAALALGAAGIRIFMHGAEDHTPDRVHTSQALAALGLPICRSLADAQASMQRWGLAFCPLDALSPAMQKVVDYKQLLNLRSPLHTAGRLVNPSQADFLLTSVTHPPYLPVHQQAAHLLNLPRMATFKGDGGEAERRPEKPCVVHFLDHGIVAQEEWQPLVDAGRPALETLDLGHLTALWSGAVDDPVDVASIIGTMALVLRYSGRAATIGQACAEADRLWNMRPRHL